MNYIVSIYPTNTNVENPEGSEFGFDSLYEVSEFIQTIFLHGLGVKVDIVRLSDNEEVSKKWQTKE